MTDITGWAHVTLSVRQHDLSVQWYSDVLGFHALASETTDRWQRTLCQHPQSGVSLVLHQHVPTSSDEFDERQIGLDHVALSTSTFDGLHAWEERLTEMGVLHSPIADAPPRGGKVLSFQDPDGLAWELFFRPMPAS